MEKPCEGAGTIDFIADFRGKHPGNYGKATHGELGRRVKMTGS
jgi:hypothetical protein